MECGHVCKTDNFEWNNALPPLRGDSHFFRLRTSTLERRRTFTIDHVIQRLRRMNTTYQYEHQSSAHLFTTIYKLLQWPWKR